MKIIGWEEMIEWCSLFRIFVGTILLCFCWWLCSSNLFLIANPFALILHQFSFRCNCSGRSPLLFETALIQYHFFFNCFQNFYLPEYLSKGIAEYRKGYYFEGNLNPNNFCKCFISKYLFEIGFLLALTNL